MRKEAIDFMEAIGNFAIAELKDIRSEHYILTALTSDSSDPKTINNGIDKLKSTLEINEKLNELETRTKLLNKLFNATEKKRKALIDAIKKQDDYGL